jgi:hypothetical protein
MNFVLTCKWFICGQRFFRPPFFNCWPCVLFDDQPSQSATRRTMLSALGVAHSSRCAVLIDACPALLVTAVRTTVGGKIRKPYRIAYGQLDTHGPSNLMPAVKAPQPPVRADGVPYRRAAIASDTPYAQRMQHLSDRIFGECMRAHTV